MGKVERKEIESTQANTPVNAPLNNTIVNKRKPPFDIISGEADEFLSKLNSLENHYLVRVLHIKLDDDTDVYSALIRKERRLA